MGKTWDLHNILAEFNLFFKRRTIKILVMWEFLALHDQVGCTLLESDYLG